MQPNPLTIAQIARACVVVQSVRGAERQRRERRVASRGRILFFFRFQAARLLDRRVTTLADVRSNVVYSLRAARAARSARPCKKREVVPDQAVR